MYVMCVHIVLFYTYEGRGRREPVEGEDGVFVFVYTYNEGRGQQELVSVKTEYDIMCC